MPMRRAAESCGGLLDALYTLSEWWLPIPYGLARSTSDYRREPGPTWSRVGLREFSYAFRRAD